MQYVVFGMLTFYNAYLYSIKSDEKALLGRNYALTFWNIRLNAIYIGNNTALCKAYAKERPTVYI